MWLFFVLGKTNGKNLDQSVSQTAASQKSCYLVQCLFVTIMLYKTTPTSLFQRIQNGSVSLLVLNNCAKGQIHFPCFLSILSSNVVCCTQIYFISIIKLSDSLFSTLLNQGLLLRFIKKNFSLSVLSITHHSFRPRPKVTFFFLTKYN